MDIKNFLLGARCWLFTHVYRRGFDNGRTPLVKDGWSLTFEDNFDGGSLDRNKWITEAYYGARFHPGRIVNRLQPPLSYLADDAVRVQGDCLILENRREITYVNYTDCGGKDWGDWDIPYVSGQVDSSRSFKQKYGYFEARAKIPSSPGTQPAFWLCSTYSWPPEIDIFEIYPGRPKHGGKGWFDSNLHWGEYKKPTQGFDHTSRRIPDPSSSFHVYGCEWSENFIKFFFDGLLVKEFRRKDVLDKWFQCPMHIIINNFVNDDFGCGIGDAEFPNHLIVDYVRAYRRTADEQ